MCLIKDGPKRMPIHTQCCTSLGIHTLYGIWFSMFYKIITPVNVKCDIKNDGNEKRPSVNGENKIKALLVTIKKSKF